MALQEIRDILSRRVHAREEELVALCCRLVQIPSESVITETRDIAATVGAFLEGVEGADVQYPVEEQPIVNVVARITGCRPGRRLVFTGHLDTFPVGDRAAWTVDPFGGVKKDGRIYGRGIANMKGGVACSIMAFKLLAECRDAWAGELVLVFAGDEEFMHVRGTKYVLDTVPHATGDAMICGDVGTSRVLRFGEKGLLWIELVAVGKMGHAAHVHKGVNAIDRLCEGILKINEALRSMQVALPEKMAGAIQKAAALSESFAGAGETQVLQSVTVSFGTIEGGVSTNLIPARASAKGDIRIPPGVTLAEVEHKVNAIVASVEGLSYRVIRAWAPNWSDPDHEIFSITGRNSRQVWGQESALTMRVGATDARLYRLLKGVPSVNCGLQGYNIGAPDEYAEIADIMKVAEIHTLSAFDFLSTVSE